MSKVKETKEERSRRIQLSGAMSTRVIPDKKKYKRTMKHKKGSLDKGAFDNLCI